MLNSYKALYKDLLINNSLGIIRMAGMGILPD